MFPKQTKWVLIFLLSMTLAGVFIWILSTNLSRVCACHKCLIEGDPWFRELINSSPKPFLSETNKISEDAFNWWKRLQSECCNFSFFNTTVNIMFKIFQPSPDIVESSPDRCRTCAVVGNSVNLKGSRYGPLIDSHDIVIRMNQGRTKGYEADVGNKTTHNVMYPESATPLENTTHLVLIPFKIGDLLWLLNTFHPGTVICNRQTNTGNLKSLANKDMVMILNPAFMKYVHEMWLGNKGRYPSKEFLTLAFSMHLCDQVSIFGFGADSDGNWSHYYEILGNKNLRTGTFPGMHEYEVIEMLHKMQKIQVFKGQ